LTGAGKVDRQAVRDALANTGDYGGVTGDMRFKPGSGDPAKGAVILRINNGNFEFFADFNPLGM
jgi:branched-chain amino acid transport system substrate-binding protein